MTKLSRAFQHKVNVQVALRAIDVLYPSVEAHPLVLAVHELYGLATAQVHEIEQAAKPKCVLCGVPVNLNVSETHCFDCYFWLEQIEVEPERRVVIGGEHYRIEDDFSGPGFRGFGGAKHVFRFHDGRVVTSRNVWHQGTIPERFRDRLPDNAVLVRE